MPPHPPASNSPRNPWPIAIIVFFICFGAFTVGLVVMSLRQKVDLVSADYYQQELRYQDQIDRLERTQGLPTKVGVAYDPAARSITLKFPAAHASQRASGQVKLYRPSAANLDRAFPLDLNAGGVQTLDAASLAAGLWRVRVSWSADSKEYYCDEKIVVKPSA